MNMRAKTREIIDRAFNALGIDSSRPIPDAKREALKILLGSWDAVDRRDKPEFTNVILNYAMLNTKEDA